MTKKATGMVRKIDELGRIVIPKEIRTTLRLRVGEPIEIFVDKNSELVLRKYSPIVELTQFAEEVVASLAEITGHVALVADRDCIVSVSGHNSKELRMRNIGYVIEFCEENRQTILETNPGEHEIARGYKEEVSSYVVSPILANGDIIGTVVLFSQTKGDKFGQVETKMAEVAANLLARQMEQE